MEAKTGAGSGNIGEALEGAALVKKALGMTNENGKTATKPEAKAPVPVKKPAAKKSTLLPGLSIKVKASDEVVDAKKIREEAKLRSEQLFGSAADYFKMCQRMDELISIKGVELTDFGKELEKLQAEKKRFDSLMGKQPQGVRSQFEVDLLIVGIDKSTPKSDSDVIGVFKRVEDAGRAHKASAEEISKIPLEERLFFAADNGDKYNLVHNMSQMPGREGQVSGADCRIFKSVRRMMWRYLEIRKKKEDADRQADIALCEKIRGEIGQDPRNLFREVCGVYVYHLLPKMVNKKPVGMPGAAKVEVYTFIKGSDQEKEVKIGLRILEAAGTLKPRWEPHPKFGWNIPFWWLKEYVKRQKEAWETDFVDDKKLLPDSVPQEMRSQVLSFLKKLFVAHRQAVVNAWKMDPISEQSKQVSDEMADKHESMRAEEPASELVEA